MSGLKIFKTYFQNTAEESRQDAFSTLQFIDDINPDLSAESAPSNNLEAYVPQSPQVRTEVF